MDAIETLEGVYKNSLHHLSYISNGDKRLNKEALSERHDLFYNHNMWPSEIDRSLMVLLHNSLEVTKVLMRQVNTLRDRVNELEQYVDMTGTIQP